MPLLYFHTLSRSWHLHFPTHVSRHFRSQLLFYPNLLLAHIAPPQVAKGDGKSAQRTTLMIAAVEMGPPQELMRKGPRLPSLACCSLVITPWFQIPCLFPPTECVLPSFSLLWLLFAQRAATTGSCWRCKTLSLLTTPWQMSLRRSLKRRARPSPLPVRRVRALLSVEWVFCFLGLITQLLLFLVVAISSTESCSTDWEFSPRRECIYQLSLVQLRCVSISPVCV